MRFRSEVRVTDRGVMKRARASAAGRAGAGPLAAGAGIAFAAMLSFPVIAAPAPKAGERVTMTACPYPGSNPACLMINGGDGTIYNITEVTPRPRLTGRMIRLRGNITDKPGTCGQGIVLERVRWTRTRQKCPN
jgi:hypothetical protein